MPLDSMLIQFNETIAVVVKDGTEALAPRVWFSVASSLSPLLHSSFRNKEMHEFMYININIIREISKIFKDTTFYLAS